MMHGTTTYLTGECCKHEFYQKYPPLMMHGAATDLTVECCKHGLHCTHPVGPVVTVYITCQYFEMSPTSWAASWDVRVHGSNSPTGAPSKVVQ